MRDLSQPQEMLGEHDSVRPGGTRRVDVLEVNVWNPVGVPGDQLGRIAAREPVIGGDVIDGVQGRGEPLVIGRVGSLGPLRTPSNDEVLGSELARELSRQLDPTLTGLWPMPVSGATPSGRLRIGEGNYHCQWRK